MPSDCKKAGMPRRTFNGERICMLSEQPLREFQESIVHAAENWQISGYTFVKWGEQTLIDRPFGYADKENRIPVTVDTRYCLSGTGQDLVALCYLLLCERGTIHSADKLSRYIPEYRQAKRITLRQLISHSSGVPDYFYGRKMLTLQNDPAHLALSERERYVKELALSGSEIDFTCFLELIGEEELEFEPGLKAEYSASECLLLAEAMARADQKSLNLQLLRELVFAPLGMDDIRLESGPAAPRYGVFRRKEFHRVPELPVLYAFTAEVSDLVKLLDALCERKLLSAQGWKKAMKRNADGDSLMCGVINGFSLFSLNAPGGGAELYFNQELGLQFCYVTGADRLSECDTSGNYIHFPRQLRDAVAAATTFPRHPHVVPFGKQNWMDACSLQVRQDQTDFVGDARTCIAVTAALQKHA